MKNELIDRVTSMCGEDSSVVIEALYNEGLLNNNFVRNYLIRCDFDVAIRQDNPELIKHIFIDISNKYNISFRQAQRIVYDHMKSKVSRIVNTI
jgi:hypothetical protein|tara:strand:- start:6493 stop:6774 length:282 start_codon:yes stop_codon:yes gene_type:complete